MSAKDNNGKELYPLYADFKKRVLLKAQEDLLEHCDIKFTFWEKKQGKKVESIVFEISHNERTKTTIKSAESGDGSVNSSDAADIKKVRQELFYELFSQAKVLEISESALRMVIEQYSPEAVQQGFEYTMLEFNKGKIKENIDGYFITAVKNGFTSVPFEKEQKKKKMTAERKEKEAKLNTLKKELAALEQNIITTQNTIIKALVATDATLTATAIEKAKINIAATPELAAYMRQFHPNLEEINIDTWRNDKVLREFVVKAIIELRPDAFIIINPLMENRLELIKAIG
jgi:hypothetical protein